MTLGRDPLRRLTGQRVATFAYPHGRADAPTAADARAVGYETAWTGSGRRYSAELMGKNLLGETYKPSQNTRSRPREFMLAFRVAL